MLTLMSTGAHYASSLFLSAQEGMPDNATILYLLKSHRELFEALGPIVLQADHALLNERQTMLLLALKRNSPTTFEFKAWLIAEFHRLAK